MIDKGYVPVQQHKTITIAGIGFSISGKPLVGLGEPYKHFPGEGEPAMTLQLHYDPPPERAFENQIPLFESEMLWRLYQIGTKRIFELVSSAPDKFPHRTAIFDEDMTQGDVYGYRLENDELLPAIPSDLLAYPLFELVMICLLAQGRGLLVHACGIDDGGRGYLFAGNSTHGKTTMARLWKDQAHILNDDRVILRWNEEDGRFWMYGTPWHGDFDGVLSYGMPLEKLFFLRHTQSNTVHRRKGTLASSLLLQRCFLPFWDANGIQSSLGLIEKLVTHVPCYELGFVPTQEVVDFIRCIK